MDTLELYRHDTKLAVYHLGSAALELGRASGCDVVLDAPDIAARQWLTVRRHGVVVLLDVSRSRRGACREQPLPSNRLFAIAADYSLKWIPAKAPAGATHEPTTEGVAMPRAAWPRTQVMVGSGDAARRLTIGEDPIHVGRHAENDVVLHDRTVSEHHLRIEPCEEGVMLRDLGSRNGTLVNGMRVHLAMLREGACVRVGRSELRIVTRSETDAAGPTMVAESSSMLHVLGDVQRMARLTWPVLVIGESGTGKEGIALALHQAGPRRDRPFVAVNAGGLARELIESELFGHERGAFTGAAGAHKGVFEQAHGGTLFLDEIGELPLSLQARLLRVIETGEIRRVGAEGTKTVDVRLVCATHRDLKAMVGRGEFRQDLYFRIARLLLEVPALRARPDDVRALCEHFLRQMVPEVGVHTLSDDAMGRLLMHHWPGNARELRNVLCAAAATAGETIEAEDVTRALQRISGGDPCDEAAVERALQLHCGNQTAAARALGMPRTTLRDRLRKGPAGAA